ncbi:PAS domain S-box protein [Solidesulfovibrio magneticus]|uniref:histidine kinase n=1 Tax=Solidesulfovibrio magneticus (strain ATCC 700980 / DSM 13731 / RS-1) TaxID=573370 RepID=C4XPW0_SOLM1|nr:PAS domain S-box protein [Solidesulfovibrio magneticus]BAH77660.1 putative sensor histidine kinase [Solidesulfovibrio magneticus RS-1]
MIELSEDLVDSLSEVIFNLIHGKKTPPIVLPDSYPENEFRQLVGYVNKFIVSYDDFAEYMYALSRGELDKTPPKSGLKVLHSYKSLQSHLLHLTWIAQQIAAGDFSQRVDFMGDFSVAFNQMAEDLSKAFHRIECQNKELSDLNFSLERNIKDLIQAKQKLTENENKLDAIVSAASDAIVLFNSRGLVVHWNRSAEKLFGFSAHEIIGHSLADHILPPTDRKVLADLIPELLNQSGDNKDRRFEMTAMRRDSSLLPIEIAFTSTRYGHENYGLAIIRDITERFRLEALKRDVERITRHDLKAPLNGIIGLPQIILDDYDLPQEVREFLILIKDSGYAMLKMIELSLDLYKMETGTYIFSPDSVDITATLKQITNELLPYFTAKQLKINYKWEQQGPLSNSPIFVEGERLLCYSMFSNLIKNALEAAPANSEIMINITAGNKVLTEIHNFGVIPNKIHDVFFDKYVTEGKKQGTGLGTYSARLFAKTQNGDIGFTSTEELGTTVWVSMMPASK